MPPPEPKMNLSNFMKVLANEVGREERREGGRKGGKEGG
jgi:hypothetical protein